MVTIRLDGPSDGRTNMTRDVELLWAAEGGRPGVRVYSWEGLWVTLGHYQRPEDTLCDPDLTPHIIRPTGGKAVVHGHDVTVGMAFPLARLGVGPRELKKAYRALAGPLIAGLRACEVDAVLAEDTRFAGLGSRVADCFAFKSANDIVDREHGMKLCGCALRMTDRAVLLQASIPVGEPLRPLSYILKGPTAPLGREWEPGRFADAFFDAAQRLSS